MLDTWPTHTLKDFIRSVPPFHSLSETELQELVLGLLIEFFQKGEVILGPDSPPAQFLYVIRSGGVRSVLPERGPDGQEITYDYREEGEDRKSVV
jgi:signal-transduction protein with cAMP-binding, CBS, and nucleotidyltransferase domain